MSERRRKITWLKALALLALVAVIVAVVFLVKNLFINNNTGSDSGQPSTNIETVEDKEKEKEKEKESNKEGYSTEKEKIEQYTGESPNKADELTGLVTYAGVSGEKLIVRLNIDQFLSTGSCSLTISKDDNVYFSQSSAIIESVTTSTCDGFEIPVSNFPSGDLRIVVLLESGGKSGKIEGEVRL